jgi:pimeloyl-ACP methyl ester carboxylesterase
VPLSAQYLPRRPPEVLQREIRGLRHHFTRWAGTRAVAPLVVLLHGFMDCGATFQFVADAIAPSRSLVAPTGAALAAPAGIPGLLVPDYFADLDAMRSGSRPARRSISSATAWVATSR